MKKLEAPAEVYRLLLWKHMDLARKDFDSQERKDMFDFITKYRAIFPRQVDEFESKCADTHGPL